MRDKRTKADPRRRLAVAVAATLGAVAAAPLFAQVNYSATLLYPLTAPSGYQVQPGVPASNDYTVAAGQTAGVAFAVATGNASSIAVLWSEPSGAVVNLNPSGFSQSSATATDGSQQVGYGTDSQGNGVALLWSGTAASAANLNPPGFVYSEAEAIGGGQEVGVGEDAADPTNGHALLWSGTAASAVDLAPTDLTGITSTLALRQPRRRSGSATAAPQAAQASKTRFFGPGAPRQP
ncbi:MAG: hypothetical protein ABSH22_22725 [Tepidisphaeraceae bacterium]